MTIRTSLEPSTESIFLLLTMIDGLCKNTYQSAVYYRMMQKAVNDGTAEGIPNETIDKFIDTVTMIRKNNARTSMLSEMFPD